MCSLAFSLSRKARFYQRDFKDAAGTLDASLKKTKTLNVSVTLNINTVRV